jgi:hypothetical protein
MSREHHSGCIPNSIMSPWLSSSFGAARSLHAQDSLCLMAACPLHTHPHEITRLDARGADLALPENRAYARFSRTHTRGDSGVEQALRAWLALMAAPIVWVLSLPLRLIGVCVESILALLRAVLLLPARMLGHRG